MSNIIIHRANERGHAEHGWLNSYHSFSFANYYNPEKMRFGALRVINDDVIESSQGFDTHPHNNMEIITIPLSGSLEHKDNMGNTSVIQAGEIQVMSAGTGILHSEYNANSDELVHLLQIWVYPNKKDVTPRYQQLSIKTDKRNQFNQILSPDKDDDGVWIHQEAWFSLGEFDEGSSVEYLLKNPTNGVYAFVIEGNATIEGVELTSKDALGIDGIKIITVTSNENNTRILLMEVPMHFSTR